MKVSAVLLGTWQGYCPECGKRMRKLAWVCEHACMCACASVQLCMWASGPSVCGDDDRSIKQELEVLAEFWRSAQPNGVLGFGNWRVSVRAFSDCMSKGVGLDVVSCKQPT